MAKSTAKADPNSSALRIPLSKGNAPQNRIINAHQVWEIAHDLERADFKRSKKRQRLFKAYNRFSPSEYSTLFKLGEDWQSNVPFGMLAFMVNNSMSSFYDMVTERSRACNIITKIGGTPREKKINSELISDTFDTFLKEWDDYLFNIEQDLLDMHLYGKGIQIKWKSEGYEREHCSADDFLVPNNATINLSNFDLCVIKRRYTLHELWNAIQEQDANSQVGWNTQVVLDTMKFQREEWKKQTSEEWTKAVYAGDITLGSHLKETVDTRVLLIREFDETISKYIVPAKLTNPLVNEKGGKAEKGGSKKADTVGMLYSKEKVADKISDIISVFMDKAGSGKWHEVPSKAEEIFVQCRQYDFTMNAIMDAVKINMSLMVQAQNGDASEKIKNITFGPWVIIPSDVPFVQKQLALPTTEATATVQFMMQDMYRGIGEYRLNDRAAGGEAVTATQNQNDTAEAAKLSGTQLKRYNTQHTLYYRRLVKDFLECRAEEDGYDAVKKFKETLDELGVPKEAYKWENIVSVNSNMLAGAGSPSYKLQAAEKTITILNIAPMNEGQAAAQEDAIAALHGRDAVSRYIQRVQPDLTFNERLVGYENQMLGDVMTNPSNIQVYPDHNHVFHINGHQVDMERSIALVNERMAKGPISPYIEEYMANKLMNQGAHTMAHIQLLSRDQGKQAMAKQAMVRMTDIQKAADQMGQQISEGRKAQKQDFDPENDPDIKKRLALDQIEISTKQQLADIEIGGKAAKHIQKVDQDKEKAANDIAITRATAKAAAGAKALAKPTAKK